MSYQPAIWQPFYNQSFTSRNLSTSPLTVGGLKGDTYDYKLIVVQYGVGANAMINIRPNGDSGTNYRRYRLYGGGSTINVEYDNTNYNTWVVNSTGTNSNHAGVFLGEITGKSGAERVMSFIWGNNYGTTYYSQFGDYWWKNTADELTSLVFHGDNVAINFDLIILQKPKLAQDAEWELVERRTLSGANISNGVFFSGLDGDRDEEYLLKGCLTASAASALCLQFNGDTGANYMNEALQNNAGTAAATNNVSSSLMQLGSSTATAAQPFVFEASIKSKTGVYRILTARSGGGTGSSDSNRLSYAAWKNTADKIESLKVYASSSSITATGHIELYRRGKSVSASKPTFETLKEVDVDGEFSQGYTFDLAGLGVPDADNESMLVLEYSGVSKTAGQANMAIAANFNGDSGNNYYLQRLNAGNSTASAASAATQHLSYWLCDPAYPSLVRFHIFPKSGKYRPVLSEGGINNGSYAYVAWWLNTADKLRSIKVYAASANQTQFKGKITLKRLAQ